MKRIISHIDDTLTARSLFLRSLRAAFPDAELRQYESVAAFREDLLKCEEADVPWMIFSDIKMREETGLQLLSWLKRHPRFHHLALVLVSAEIDDQTRAMGRSLGVFGQLGKPIVQEELVGIVKKREAEPADSGELARLDQGFAASGLKLVQQGRALLPALVAAGSEGPVRVQEIQSRLGHVLHTLKGEALSLQFPTLAQFIQSSEELLAVIKRAGAHTFSDTPKILESIFDYLRTQLDRIPEGELLELPSPELESRMDGFKITIESGWKLAQEMVALNGPSRQESQDLSDSIAISIDRLDLLQSSIKRILRQTVQIGNIANELNSPQLSERIRELSEDELNLVNVLMAILSAPAMQLKSFFEQTVHQTSRMLGKEVIPEADIPEGLELDQVVLETLKYAITHLVRNSIDHGIEAPEERDRLGKPRPGRIRLHLQSKRRHQIVLELEDDGRGFDLPAIREAAERKGLKTRQELAKLSDQEVLDLVFTDDFSTRTEASLVSGRGVGLGAVQQLLGAKGGSIDVRSTAGQGSRFQVKLSRVLRIME